MSAQNAQLWLKRTIGESSESWFTYDELFDSWFTYDESFDSTILTSVMTRFKCVVGPMLTIWPHDRISDSLTIFPWWVTLHLTHMLVVVLSLVDSRRTISESESTLLTKNVQIWVIWPGIYFLCRPIDKKPCYFFLTPDFINSVISQYNGAYEHWITTLSVRKKILHALHYFKWKILIIRYFSSYTGWPNKNGTVDAVDFSGLCSDQQCYLFSHCWIEHLFLNIITPRSSNLVYE